MRDSWFWRVMACLALVVALGYVAAQWRAAPPVHAQAGNIIAVADGQGNEFRLYLVDTSRKVLLVYGGGGTAHRFSLLATRFFDIDAKAAVGREFKYKQNGYPSTEMNRHVPRGP